MKNIVSNLSPIKINTLFLEKMKDYIAIMKNFISPEEIEDRKEEVLANLEPLLNEYTVAKAKLKDIKDINDKAKRDIRIANGIDVINERYEKASERLSTLLNDEFAFLHFFTSDFSSQSNDHGLEYTEDGVKYYTGIDKSIASSIIRIVDINKRRENKPFNYPKELEEEDNGPLRYYQVKDTIVLDMMELFGDNFVKMYFLGKGSLYNDKMMQLFNGVASINQRRITEELIKSDDEGHPMSEAEVIGKIALDERTNFDQGINKSVYTNNEDYYNYYMNLIQFAKGQGLGYQQTESKKNSK